jgi:SET domain-containing protein
MNHSEAPNTDFTGFEAGYAIRDIEVGEEITCNYHEFDPTFTGWFPSVKRAQNGAHAHS